MLNTCLCNFGQLIVVTCPLNFSPAENNIDFHNHSTLRLDNSFFACCYGLNWHKYNKSKCIEGSFYTFAVIYPLPTLATVEVCYYKYNKHAPDDEVAQSSINEDSVQI